MVYKVLPVSALAHSSLILGPAIFSIGPLLHDSIIASFLLVVLIQYVMVLACIPGLKPGQANLYLDRFSNLAITNITNDCSIREYLPIASSKYAKCEFVTAAIILYLYRTRYTCSYIWSYKA